MPLLPAGRQPSLRPPLRRLTHIINVQDAPLTHGFTMHPRQNLRLAQYPQALAPLVATLHSEKGQYSGKQPRGPVRMVGEWGWQGSAASTGEPFGETMLFCCSVTKSSPNLCDPMDWSTPGFPVHHQLPEFAQTHIHQVSDVIQPSHPLSLPSLPAFCLSQHQGLFQ